jgi:hypothetical protein
MHLPCKDGDPSRSVPASQEPFCDASDSLMDEVIERQVGGGPSPYRLRSNINLTPRAAEESRIAAGLRRVHYNNGSSAAVDPVDDTEALLSMCVDADTEALLSMCVDAPIELTPTPPHRHVHPRIRAPPTEANDIFSTLSPSSPLTPGPSGPSHLSDHILDRTLQLLDFVPVLPARPAVPRPQPTLHVVDEEGDDKEGGDNQHTLATPPPLVRNMDDDRDDDDSEASPRGRYSNTDLEILDDAFKACRDILSEAADKVQRPFRSVIKQFQAANGHVVGKSEWNVFQIYFAANMHEVRDQVGDPTGDGKCSSLSTYQFPDDILAKACWKIFKRLPNYKEMLETWTSLQSTEYTGITLQQRRRAFDHEVKRFSKMVHHLSLFAFFC